MARRNNSGRMNAPPGPSDNTTPLPAMQPENDGLFSFVTPTELVDLPSKGTLYPPDHPLHNEETVEIKHMTAKEEDILTSETLLRKGLALDRLLQSVIVNKKVKPDSLLVGDKNALLIAVRETGFGSIYTTSVSCSQCGVLNTKDFSLDEKTYVESDLPENVTQLENGNFLLDIAEHDLVVEIRLLTGADEKKITQIMESRKKMKLNSATVTQVLKSMLVSVNGASDAQTLQAFVDRVPASLSRRIRSTYDSVMPNIQIFNTFACDECNHMEILEVPMSVGFFWPEL